ncbi:MAG TPA: tetratricopeptide repeat protein, partial [Bacteroidota bacterium]|nr:tetratricopeptide repeat protein [Bacteroidota bacterium]
MDVAKVKQSVGKNILLPALFMVCLTTTAHAQWIQDSTIDRYVQTGIQHIYNFEFEKAEHDVAEVIRLQPDHPVGYFFRAMIQWERILCNFDDESQDDKLYQDLEVVIEMCEKRLDENPKDVTAMFFKGGAVGFRGRLRANRGKWLGAANDGMVALPLVRKAYSLEPNNDDVLLGIGIYNYYAEIIPDNYPVAKPFMLFFPSGDKKKGLEQLRLASEHAKYANVEASYFLMQSYYMFEKDFPKAYRIAVRLHERFPRNSIFYRFLGRILVSLGKIGEARDVFNDIQQMCDAKVLGYDTFDKREAVFYLGKFEFMANRFDTALNYLYQCDVLSSKLDKDGSS